MGLRVAESLKRSVGRRRVRTLAVLALGPLLLLLWSAGPASAHATLLFASPAAEGGVPDPPSALTLTFDNPVTLPPDALRLTGPTDTPVDLGAPRLTGAAHSVQAAVTRRIAVGVYTVTWQVIASDGDAITGTYRFAVGTSAAGLSASASGNTATPGALRTALARWTLFAALALLAGAAALPRLARRARIDALDRRRCEIAAGIAGLLAAAVLFDVQSGGGSLLHSPAHLDSALTARAGVITLVEATAFAAAIVPALTRRPRWHALPATVIVFCEALRAHPHEYAPTLGLLATLVHLAAVALWLGSLVHVAAYALTHHNEPKAARRLWRAYARYAAFLFTAALASGALAALLLVPLSELVSTGYGQALLAKAALVALVALLALTARRRLHADRAVLPPARFEAATLTGVLALAAALTVLAPPKTTSTDLPFAPPASGPAVALGARAGQIGVFAQASQGQLVIRLTAPGADTTGAQAQGTAAPGAAVISSAPPIVYRLSAILTDPADTTRPLALRGCGAGCFVAPAAWADGSSVLTLTASATGWNGGRAAFAVPWPPHPGNAALRNLAAALHTTGKLTLFEQVTSDTTATPAAQRLDLTGPYLLGAEPYSGGQAPDADLVPGPGSGSTLLLGYPAENIAVRLILDHGARPVSETLTDPDHLTTRTFDYTESSR